MKTGVLLCVAASAAVLAGCGSLHLYQPPEDGPRATIELRNRTPHPVAMHIYEDATLCTDMRQAQWAAAGSSLQVMVTARAPTAYSLSYEYMAGGKGRNCLVAVSFQPQAGAFYVMQFEQAGERCTVAVARQDGATLTPVAVDGREFLRGNPVGDPHCAMKQ